jgi:uncharacterized membrane protein YccC
VVPITKFLALLIMAAGGIGTLLGVLAALFRAGGAGADSWLFVMTSVLWGVACLWIGSRIIRVSAPAPWEVCLMLVLYIPVLGLAYRLTVGRGVG